jgi:hypothetical protein
VIPVATIALMPADDVAMVLDGVEADSVVLMIRPGRGATALALVRAAIVASAQERAPRRLNAVEPGEHTDPAAIEQAVAYLHAAPAVTAQVIRLG